MTTIRDKKGSPWFTALRQRPYAYHSLRTDPRVSYTLHFPSAFLSNPSKYRLIVVVHGSGRAATDYREAFAEFADQHQCVVLCPLFPMGVRGDGYADGYKNLIEGDIRYDELLLSMVADVEEASGHAFGKFYLFGFSGGGQFVHRFFYVHPERLHSVSIGAPGTITRIDDSRDWWFGTRDIESVLGKKLNIKAMQAVAIQMVVGAEDIEEFEIPSWMRATVESLGPIGKNRIERLQILKRNYEQFGISVQFDLLPGVAHQGLKVVTAVQDFIRTQLEK